MMELTTLTLDKFIETTASGAPVPGGGSISALCGSLAAALGQMVARLTIGKKKYVDVQSQMEAIIEKLEPACGLLMRSIDLDSEAYDQVFQAYKLPKETEDEKRLRHDTIQMAMQHAANVPLAVARIAASILPELLIAAELGNQNAITDAYVATLCARTAIFGACANVKINLSSIDDQDFVNDANKETAKFEEEADEAEKKARKLLDAALKG